MIKKFFSLLNLKSFDNEKNTNKNFSDIFVDDLEKDCSILNLNKISLLSNNITGMISGRTGEELFAIAYMQQLRGDVVEVGSFQGKSTMFLGMATKYSGNGHLYAIDHFRGNKGKENFYVVKKKDLSDLQSNFKRNIDKANLKNFCTLINKSNHVAANKIKNKSIRLLFIDGDHTSEGVKKDLELFLPKLKRKAIIIFDDYDNKNYSELCKVVNNFIKIKKIKKKYVIGRILVVQI